jgi:hypothetical protein
MPIPRPRPNQTENEFMRECILAIGNEYSPQQSSAICYDAWLNRPKQKNKPHAKRRLD